MNTFEQIIDIIRQNQTPYISLYVRDQLKTVPAGKFQCETCTDGSDKTEAAITWLTNYVKLFPVETVFVIQAKKSLTSNQGNTIGPLSFTRSGTGTAVTGSVPALSGLDPTSLSSLGYVPRQEIDKERALLQLDFERQLMQHQLDTMKQQYEQSLKNIQDTYNLWSPATVSAVIDKVVSAYAQLKNGQTNVLQGLDLQKQQTSPFVKKINTELQNLSQEQQALVTKILLKTIEKIKNDGRKTTTNSVSRNPEFPNAESSDRSFDGVHGRTTPEDV